MAKDRSPLIRKAAGRQRSGFQRFASSLNGSWCLLALFGLTACVQPAADPAPTTPKENSAMTAANSNPAISTTPEQAADVAAAAVDRAAGQPSALARLPGGRSPLPLPQGPKLEVTDLRARVLKLVGGLRTAQDTEAVTVAQILNLPFGPDPEDPNGQVVEGRLGNAGRYYATVTSAGHDMPGKEIEVRFIPEGWKGDPRIAENALSTCSLDFSAFNEDIAKLGYSGTEGPSYLKEFWSYRKDWPASNISFYLVVNIYRATTDDQPKGRPCVLSIEISADSTKVDRG